MKQNPTIPAVLENACAALTNIAWDFKNQVIAGAAGAIQVHVSASSYLTTKKQNKKTKKKFPRTALHPSTPLPLVFQPLPSE